MSTEQDFCPECNSKNTMFQYDSSDLIRTFLHCNNCKYLEARNINQIVDQEIEQEEPWEQESDWWKYTSSTLY